MEHFFFLISFDIKLQKWKEIEPMQYGRYNHAIAVLNGNIYVVGGGNDEIRSKSAECYRPKANMWVKISNMNSSHRIPSLSVLNGYLFVMSNDIVERYDPIQNIWTLVCIELP